MKGKHYKPSKISSISEKKLNLRPKPWNETPKFPSIYFWKSSIPEKYFKDKSRVFKHISETNRTKNTEEFLKKSQKYIEIIADSHRHTPSMRASILNSRESSLDEKDLQESHGNLLIAPKMLGDCSTGIGHSETLLKVVESINLDSNKNPKQSDNFKTNSKRLLTRRASMPKLYEDQQKPSLATKRQSMVSNEEIKQGLTPNFFHPRIKYTLNFTSLKKRNSLF